MVCVCCLSSYFIDIHLGAVELVDTVVYYCDFGVMMRAALEPTHLHWRPTSTNVYHFSIFVMVSSQRELVGDNDAQCCVTCFGAALLIRRKINRWLVGTLVIFGWFWQFLAIFGYSRRFLAIFDDFRSFSAIFGYFQLFSSLFLTNFVQLLQNSPHFLYFHMKTLKLAKSSHFQASSS